MRRQDLQAFENNVYIADRIPGLGIPHAYGAAVPTNGAVGYSPFCIWQNLNATSDANAWYINGGTLLSATWIPLSLAALAPADRIVSLTAATLAVTLASHDSKTILMNVATGGLAITLPAPTGSGARYKFVVGTAVSSGSTTITATGAYLYGTAQMVTDSSSAQPTMTGFATAPSTTITLNGSTKGGLIGDVIEIEDVATNKMQVTMFAHTTGTVVTPFS
jgi:hypothetical protein